MPDAGVPLSLRCVVAPWRAGVVPLIGRRCRSWFGDLPQPFSGKGGEDGVEVDADEPPTEGEDGQAGGPGAAERVQHHAAGLASGLDAAGGPT
jgi:hypothetical protein